MYSIFLNLFIVLFFMHVQYIMCKLRKCVCELFFLFSDKIYPIKDKSPDRKRLALLINNVEFKYIDDRTGADKDELKMEMLLNGLGYTVVTLRDLTAQVRTSVFKPNRPVYLSQLCHFKKKKY